MPAGAALLALPTMMLGSAEVAVVEVKLLRALMLASTPWKVLTAPDMPPSALIFDWKLAERLSNTDSGWASTDISLDTMPLMSRPEPIPGVEMPTVTSNERIQNTRLSASSNQT